MNELIKIELNENKEPVVSGRELHKKLKSKEQYTNWIKRHLDYGYKENVDYTILKGYLLESGFVEENSFNNKNIINRNNESMRGKSAKDHALTLDTAKEIAMLQRNKIGRQIRLYFIKFEKEHNKLPNDPFLQVMGMPTTEKQIKRNKMLKNQGWEQDDIDIRQLNAKANNRFKELAKSKGLVDYQIMALTKRINKAVFGMGAHELKKMLGASKWDETRNILPKSRMRLNLLFIETNVSSEFEKYDKISYYRAKRIVTRVCDAVNSIEDTSMVLSLSEKAQSKITDYFKPVKKDTTGVI
jgi:phage anti-repressor protein